MAVLHAAHAARSLLLRPSTRVRIRLRGKYSAGSRFSGKVSFRQSGADDYFAGQVNGRPSKRAGLRHPFGHDLPNQSADTFLHQHHRHANHHFKPRTPMSRTKFHVAGVLMAIEIVATTTARIFIGFSILQSFRGDRR